MAEEIIGEEAEAATAEAQEADEIRRAGAFFGPEAFAVLPWAIFLDIIGVILFCFVLDDFFLLDIVSISTIGLWSFWRSQMIGRAPTGGPPSISRRGKGPTVTTKWAGRLKWLRPLCIIGEIVPYLGVGPWLTLWVIGELKS